MREGDNALTFYSIATVYHIYLVGIGVKPSELYYVVIKMEMDFFFISFLNQSLKRSRIVTKIISSNYYLFE